jgi:hypothetical protein
LAAGLGCCIGGALGHYSRVFLLAERSMRVGLIAGALACWASFACGGERSSADSTSCSLEQVAPVEIAAIDSEFDILTDDGRRVALVGLEIPADPSLREQARAFLTARLGSGRLAFLALASSVPDRWGRLAGGLFIVGEGADGPLVSVAERLLRAGLSRFRPDAAAFACRNAFLAAEREARDRRLGVWANDEYVVGDARMGDALLRRKGMVLVEGVVAGVGETAGSLYLNFGAKRGADFSVVIWKRNLENFVQAGVDPRKLVGRRVRVRGLIDRTFGPRMEIAGPAELEMVDAVVSR